MCEHCGCTDEGAGFSLINPAKDKHNHDHGHSHFHDHSHGEHHHDHSHGHSHDTPRISSQSARVEIGTDILSRNNLLAERNRGYFDAKGIIALNLVSSPGSGKTTLLERTLIAWSGPPVYVIEGDQQTTLDADRIEAAGAPVIQVNTGSGCHLDASMIHHALKALDPGNGSLVLIENVGNLVCPALFDLGENYRIVIISVTEGEDKPLKYPNMFQSAQLCLINKTDLLPYVDFSLEKMKKFALQVNPTITFIELSAKTGEGFQQWVDWIREVIGKG